MKEFVSKSEEETFAFGRNFAQTLKGGEVIALNGDLGAGKTIFTKGLAAGLGINEVITSPTFVIMKVYPIMNSQLRITNFVHIDAYRLKSEAELEAIGAPDYFGRADTVVVIEWAGKIKGILPPGVRFLSFSLKNNLRAISY